jgi:integrase
LGTAEQGWTATSAKDELERKLAAVKLGQWRPPAAQEVVQAPPEIPGFHVFSSEWWERKKDQLAAKTQIDYRWRLNHLLLFFETYALDAIDVDAVDRFVSLKLKEGLSPRSTNMQVILLAAILEDGVERGLIASNPARGRRRRAKERAPLRLYLENAGQIEALLNAAGELDAEATNHRRHVQRRAMLATLVFSGVRISELFELRWRAVDLATDWLTVSGSKTDAATRKIKIRPILHEALVSAMSPSAVGGEAYVFPTRTGRRMTETNFRRRVLAGAVRRANENLAEAKQPPLPTKLTPHSLRRTFASVLYALGEDPGVVMDEMGHTNPGLALRIYRQAMRRDEGEKRTLRALVECKPQRKARRVLAANGSTEEHGGSDPTAAA